MKYIATLIVLAGFAFWYSFIRTPEAPPAPLTYSASFVGLTDAEKSYYEQMFDYTMDRTQPGQAYDWQTFGAKGKITPDAVFISKSNVNCRNFNEIFYVQDTPHNYQGVACKRQGRDGWCRLKKTDALTCALEDTGALANFNLPGLPSVSTPGSVNFPAGGVGNVGGVSAPSGPETESPKIDQKQAGQGYADTVTGTAGRAAGPATSNGIKWFNNTFR